MAEILTDPRFANRFFSMITLLMLGLDVALIVLLVGRERLAGAVEWVNDLFGGAVLWFAWLLAFGATVGSLFYSEVIGFSPCQLCWYQRAVWYPLVLILPYFAWKHDTRPIPWLLGFVGIGWVIAAYHYTIQNLPGLDAGVCNEAVPCTLRWVWEFGFVSIPMMSLAGLTLVGLLLLWGRINEANEG
jgi:disulfide bond formation protein DsbB